MFTSFKDFDQADPVASWQSFEGLKVHEVYQFERSTNHTVAKLFWNESSAKPCNPGKGNKASTEWWLQEIRVKNHYTPLLEPLIITPLLLYLGILNYEPSHHKQSEYVICPALFHLVGSFTSLCHNWYYPLFQLRWGAENLMLIFEELKKMVSCLAWNLMIKSGLWNSRFQNVTTISLIRVWKLSKSLTKKTTARLCPFSSNLFRWPHEMARGTP